MAVLTGPDPGDDRATRDAHRAAVGWLAEIARLMRSAPIHLACCPRPKAEVVAGQGGGHPRERQRDPDPQRCPPLELGRRGPHPTAG